MIATCFRQIIVYGLFLSVLTSCTVAKPKTSNPYAPNVSEILSGKAILGREVKNDELPSVDLFAVTPEMEAFARQATRRSDNYFDKVKDLHVALLSPNSG